VLDQQIAAATTQLMQAHMDRAQAEATLDRVKSMVNSGHAAEVSQVVSSQLITQLRQQEAELVQKRAELSARYGSEHPKMLDLMAEKRDLDAKINIEIQRVVGTAANDVAVACAWEVALQASLKELEGRSGGQGQARVEERELQAAATSSRALYDSFVERAKQIEQEQTLQIPEARIISRSPIPQSQSFPPLLIVFASSIPLSLLFGILVARTLERLDHGFRTSARLEEVLKLPVLAALPELSQQSKRRSGSKRSADDDVVDRPMGAFAESVRGLLMGLTLSNVDETPKVVLVTSAIPGEGKTTVALSLARHLAQTGRRVVLVDGDLRRPSIQASAGASAGEFDLIDVLVGHCPLDRATTKDPQSSALLLPVTKHVTNAPDLLDSQAMRKLVAALSTVFDMVIVDSAPILPVNDTRILATFADAVVFVVRWESTPRRAASDAVRVLRDARAPIAGAVLSCAETKRYYYYSFGNESSGYSRYYE
jgi:capsular exopolysaccharide synthesis family protein